MTILELSLVFRLLLTILTCYRLARMIAKDDGPLFIFKRLRYLIKDKAWYEADKNGYTYGAEISDRWFGKWHNLNEGISCPYCLGVWLSLPLIFLFLYPSFYGDIFLVLMSISGGQAFLQSLRDE